jgi:hypothetical protein
MTAVGFAGPIPSRASTFDRLLLELEEVQLLLSVIGVPKRGVDGLLGVFTR